MLKNVMCVCVLTLGLVACSEKDAEDAQKGLANAGSQVADGLGKAKDSVGGALGATKDKMVAALRSQLDKIDIAGLKQKAQSMTGSAKTGLLEKIGLLDKKRAAAGELVKQLLSGGKDKLGGLVKKAGTVLSELKSSWDAARQAAK